MKKAKKLIVLAMCLFMTLSLLPAKISKAEAHDSFATAESIELNTDVTGSLGADSQHFYKFTTLSDPNITYSVTVQCLNINEIKKWGSVSGNDDYLPLYIYDNQFERIRHTPTMDRSTPARTVDLTLSPSTTYYAVTNTIKGLDNGQVVNYSFKINAVTEVEAMYRLYNRVTGEHFYTANERERDILTTYDWNYEGIGWYAPVKSSTPVYRLYNPKASDHHYTTNIKERDFLVNAGWRYEGIGWYSDDYKAVPLYREFNPGAKAGAHNYTRNPAEHKLLVSNGWKDEGIGWYGVNYTN